MEEQNYKERLELYIKDLRLDNEKLNQDIEYMEKQKSNYDRSISNSLERIELNNAEIARVKALL